jgi:serine/threonine protein kinase/tetratricopeptide (TPR) repeat protein
LPALTQVIQANLPSHYKIIKLLNQGGMGEIYLAEDQRLQRTVAIKILKPELANKSVNGNSNDNRHNDHNDCTDAQAIEVALHEARLLAKLNHANIVQIYDITQQDQQISLVMEYLNGKTLQNYQQEHICTLSQKLAIISQISKGLTAAHNHGIVHCDLKPNNIIIDENGGVKIVDFGIAKLNKTDTNSALVNNSQSFGSQTAMSPEQLRNVLPNADIQDIDFRSDLFSLGIIAFQLISGQHPFASDSASNTAKKILQAQCQQAQDIVPRLPRELISLLNSLLANKVEDRPQSSQWVTEQFEQITKHLSQQEILAEDTQPLSAELSTELAAGLENANIDDIKSIKNKNRSFIFSAFALLTALLVTAGIYSDELFAPAELSVRYVVVLPATVTQKNPQQPIADMQKELVTATLDDAIRQSIINTKGLRLISRSEVAGVSTDSSGETASIASIAAATGASDIITTQLDCNNVKCDVTLSRLTADSSINTNISNKDENAVETVIKKWTVLTQKKWPSQVESYYDIYQHSKANLASIFSNYNTSILTEQPIKPVDYQNYVMLYNQIMIAGNSSEANLQQLQAIIISSPYLYAAYSLYRENALNLYNETNESKYIKQIENIITSAPKEYKQSVFQTLDSFAIALTAGKIDKAKKQLNVAVEQGLDESTLMEYQAALLLNNNEIQPAIQQYETALTLRPSTKLLYNLALSYYWLGDFTNSKQILIKLLKALPDKYNAKQLLADIYLSEGALNLAIAQYEDITKINSESSDIDNLGLAYTLAGRYQDALQMAILSVTRSPEHPTAILNLADIKLILGYTEQATPLYKRVIQLSNQQEDLEALLINAQAYVHLGQHKQAIKAINQAKKLAPDNGEVAFSAALVYSQLGERISAINQVEEALAANFGFVWFNLPWFDSLCENSDFKQILTKAGNSHRCPL